MWVRIKEHNQTNKHKTTEQIANRTLYETAAKHVVGQVHIRKVPGPVQLRKLQQKKKQIVLVLA